MSLPAFANPNSLSAMLPSQPSATEQMYGFSQSQILGPTQRMSASTSSQYGNSYDNSPQILGYQQQVASNARRTSQHDGYSSHDSPEYGSVRAPAVSAEYQYAPGFVTHSHAMYYEGTNSLAYPYSAAASPQGSPNSLSPGSLPPIHHHHHHLPNQQLSNAKHRRRPSGWDYPSSPDEHGPPSVVGQPGMPEPAARPKGPKLKFTPEDDALLVELKETKNLTWKQIADFFPGRSSGTLQVRYCTKLKAKTTAWTDEMVQKLRSAMQEYDDDRWRIVAAKVGGGLSASACREKAWELQIEEGVEPSPEQQAQDDMAKDHTSASSVEP